MSNEDILSGDNSYDGYDESPEEREVRLKQEAHQKEMVRAQNELQQAYRNVFGSVEGKKVLEHLRQYAGYGYPSYTVGNQSVNAGKDAIFHDGQKDIVALIVTQVSRPLQKVEEKQDKAE